MSSARLTLRGAAGFALIPALFLIVVLGALAAVAVRVSMGQSEAVLLSLQQARALAAARAGIEWGAYRAIKNGSCAGTTLNLTEASLNGFQVVVTCTATTFAEGAAASLHSYSVSSTATSGTYGKPGYVQRVVRSTFTDAT
jgi:MSHA biogenesis protein MshP